MLRAPTSRILKSAFEVHASGSSRYMERFSERASAMGSGNLWTSRNLAVNSSVLKLLKTADFPTAEYHRQLKAIVTEETGRTFVPLGEHLNRADTLAHDRDSLSSEFWHILDDDSHQFAEILHGGEGQSRIGFAWKLELPSTVFKLEGFM